MLPRATFWRFQGKQDVTAQDVTKKTVEEARMQNGTKIQCGNRDTYVNIPTFSARSAST
jgi:hypothetical protein